MNPSSSSRKEMLKLNLITAFIGAGQIDEAAAALEAYDGPRGSRYYLRQAMVSIEICTVFSPTRRSPALPGASRGA